MVRRKNGTKHAFWGLPKSYGQRPLNDPEQPDAPEDEDWASHDAVVESKKQRCDDETVCVLALYGRTSNQGVIPSTLPMPAEMTSYVAT